MVPPLSVVNIVKYCGVGGGGFEGRRNPTKNNGVRLFVIKIVKYCGVWGSIGGEGAKIPQKIMTPPLSVIKITKYCGVGEGGIGGVKTLQKIKNRS